MLTGPVEAGLQIEERPTTVGPRLRLRLLARPQLGRSVRQQVVAFTAALGIDETGICDFLTALGEALANAIEHSGTQQPIEVTVWLVPPDHLVATVVDNGIGFDEAQAGTVNPHLPDAYSERGRGLPIMRACTDVFSIRSVPGSGTTVTLGRHVPRDPSPRLRYAAG